MRFELTLCDRALPQSHFRSTAPSRREPYIRFICEGFLSTFSFSSFLLKEDERESRRKENKEERAAVGLVSLRLGHATALTPHCGVIHYRGAVSLRSRELLNKFKIPPLATDCVTPVRKSDSTGFACLRRLFVHRKRRKIRYPRSIRQIGICRSDKLKLSGAS